MWIWGGGSPLLERWDAGGGWGGGGGEGVVVIQRQLGSFCIFVKNIMKGLIWRTLNISLALYLKYVIF